MLLYAFYIIKTNGLSFEEARKKEFTLSEIQVASIDLLLYFDEIIFCDGNYLFREKQKVESLQ